MRQFVRVAALGLAVMVAVGLAGCGTADAGAGAGSNEGGASGGEVQTLALARVGITQDAAIQIAREQGYYAEHGIEVTDQVVANPPAALAAVQSGQIDIAYTPTTSFFAALSQGMELQVVAPSDGYPTAAEASGDPADHDSTGLFVQPESGITDGAGLVGKTIAVPARNAQLEVTIASYIEKAGGDPTTVNWVVLDFASAVEALKNGTVDAAGVVSPFTTQALQAGMVQLVAPGAAFFDGGTAGLWVSTPSIIAAKGSAIDGFIAAQAQANDYANAHLEEALAIGKEISGSDLPVSEITPPYWVSTPVTVADLEDQEARIRAMGYLPAPIDLSNVVYTPSS